MPSSEQRGRERALLLEREIASLVERCGELGASCRVQTSFDGDCKIVIDGESFDDLASAVARVEQLDRVLG